MKSIKEIFIVGNGPSSSHTISPSKALDYILNKYQDIDKIEIILYGSLALTGKGHLIDVVINNKLKNINHHIKFDYFTKVNHPNTMDFIIHKNNELFKERIYSIGGGTIKVKGAKSNKIVEIYNENTLKEILFYCKENNKTLLEYVLEKENDILIYLKNILKIMDEAANRGINNVGELPGSLHVIKKANAIYNEAIKNDNDNLKNNALVMAYAFAVSEENASGGIVATAPTCGSCGVIPGVIKYLRLNNIDDNKIIESLAVAGLIGEIIKTNATVRGALAGCQAEIGAASSMASAMIMNAFNANNEKIAQAAEIALEHSLGLTCDPIDGYVQIPCIERNSIFALKSINASQLAFLIDSDSSKISFDEIVKTMYETGKDLKSGYKETSKAGMSKLLSK